MNQYEAIESLINSQEQQLETLKAEYKKILPQVTVSITVTRPGSKMTTRTLNIPTKYAPYYNEVIELKLPSYRMAIDMIKVILGCPDKRLWAYKYTYGILGFNLSHSYGVCNIIKSLYDNCLDASEKGRLVEFHKIITSKNMTIHMFYNDQTVSNETLKDLKKLYSKHGSEHSEKIAKMVKIIGIMNNAGLHYESLMEHRKEAVDAWLRDKYRCLLTLE